MAMNQARVHEPAKGERCQNGYLVGHVESFDVVDWIGLGESEPLRAGERIVETLAVLFHCGENVVSGPVQDPCDTRYLICLQSALDRRDQRDAAANCRFEQHGHVVAMSELEDFRSVPCDHFFVGGDNVLAVFDRALDRFVDVLDAARYFDDLIIREDRNPRGRKKGETGALILEGVYEAMATGARVGSVEVVVDEMDATRKALDRSRPGDLVVLCVDYATEVYREIEARRGVASPNVLAASEDGDGRKVEAVGGDPDLMVP